MMLSEATTHEKLNDTGNTTGETNEQPDRRTDRRRGRNEDKRKRGNESAEGQRSGRPPRACKNPADAQAQFHLAWIVYSKQHNLGMNFKWWITIAISTSWPNVLYMQLPDCKERIDYHMGSLVVLLAFFVMGNFIHKVYYF